jgi:hypothetical protein
MTWIIVNFVFFALNLFFAITGTDQGWIIWSAFCSGLSFGIFMMLVAEGAGKNADY